MARTRRTQVPPLRLILDSGAVIGLSRNEERARAALAAAHEAGAVVSLPSVVVAETVRGTARDARVNRIVKAVGHVSAADEATARLAGGLLGAADSSSTFDAVVVATAIDAGGAVILTGDADDLGQLSEHNPEVTIEPI